MTWLIIAGIIFRIASSSLQKKVGWDKRGREKEKHITWWWRLMAHYHHQEYLAYFNNRFPLFLSSFCSFCPHHLLIIWIPQFKYWNESSNHASCSSHFFAPAPPDMRWAVVRASWLKSQTTDHYLKSKTKDERISHLNRWKSDYSK